MDFRASWGAPGHLLGRLEASWGRLGAVLGSFGAKGGAAGLTRSGMREAPFGN